MATVLWATNGGGRSTAGRPIGARRRDRRPRRMPVGRAAAGGATAGRPPPLDAKGVMAGSPDADRCIGYITKYLVKDIAECHEAETAMQADHTDRLLEALRYEPCSPTCANWLRYGIQPKSAKAGLTPGYCKSKAHRREHLGYAGRRVLVSRKWSGKTLTDHKNDRKNRVLARLAEAGVSATGHPTDPGRYACSANSIRIMRTVLSTSPS
ncbi:replication initiator [Actinoallomurus acaciae]|uniref:Replication initiator n=1 Tax=Actinoallomurus acaciae TaxID=502577 RepID=A0ABV5YI61_9ACTN